MISNQIREQLDFVGAPTGEPGVAHDVGAVFMVRARRDRTTDVVQESGREEHVTIGRLEAMQLGEAVEEL